MQNSIFASLPRIRSLPLAAVALALAPTSLLHAQTACDADTNGDGIVDSADLGALLSEWGPCAGCAADLAQRGGAVPLQRAGAL